LLLVGRVARAHGNRGQVIVNLETDFPEERFKVGQVLQVGPEQHPVARRIDDVRFHQGRPIVTLEGVSSMNEAEALAGAELRIAEDEIPPLPDGTFYRHDLVGCDVVDTERQPIGRVTRVEGTLERSYLVVGAPDGREILIPLAAEICVRVDPAAGVIVVNPPEGLLDVNER
jgi:16S rRNA processing protein RimM